MKTSLFILILFVPFMINAQSTSPQLTTSSGAYYSNATTSLSWTVGEIATETFASGNNILTQGFQQPVSVSITGVNLDLLVFLEGTYGGTQMNNTLNTSGVLPLAQPYSTPPWNYPGSENVSAIPNSNVVDWVLVELRDANNPASATPATKIGQQAAFLLKDGSVVGMDGSSILYFNVTVNHNLYVVLWHRNHLGILSANALSQSGGVFNYDFSTAATQVYNGTAGYKEISTGVYGMVAGDANGDGIINIADQNLWNAKAGEKGYKSTDFNMDVQVNNPDKNDFFVPNDGNYNSQVPD